MEAKVKFANTLTSGLDRMLAAGSHADVTVVVDGKVFPCHKVILSAMSAYFEAMFNHDVVETRGGIVTLHDVEPHIFERMLKFMYTGDDVLTTLNAEQIFKAASMLQISGMQDRCEEFLLKEVTKQNCVGIWRLARSYNCLKLEEKSLHEILKNFSYISTSEEFQRMESDELVCIIKSNKLCSPDEESVCDAVMNWAKYDVTRKRHFHDIFPFLRLALVSPDYLMNLINVVKDDFDTDLSIHLKDAFKWHICPSKRTTYSSDVFLQRDQSKYNDCLVVIGGLLKTVPRFQTTKEVICYSFQQEQWFYLPSLPYDPGYEFAVCSHGSDIYVSGGWLKLQGMAVFKAAKNKWKTCDVMANGRCGHAMVAMTSSVYVLGGRDGTAPAMTNIEHFNTKTKKWRIAGELRLGIRSMSAVAVGENVFLYGGILENDRDSDKVQCFDTRQEVSTIIGGLPFACRLTRTVVVDEEVFIVLPDGRVLTFDHSSSRVRIQSLSEFSFSSDTDDDCGGAEVPSNLAENVVIPCPTSPKTVMSTSTIDADEVLGKIRGRIQKFNQHHFEAVQHCGKLLLAGGKTPDNTILRDIMVLDPSTMKLTKTVEMPTARWCFGCVKTLIGTDALINSIGVV